MVFDKQLISAGMAAALLLAASGVQANPDNAKNLCKQTIKQAEAPHYSHFHGVAANKVANGQFSVNGKVKDDRDGKDHDFNCEVRHGEVNSWYVMPATGSGKEPTAAEVGAGLLALAVVAAVAANIDDDDHQQRKSSHSSGETNPFDDMHYLKKECKHEIRRHLRHDHGKIDSLEIKTADLDGRKLSGRAKVRFKDSEHHKMDYACHFNRSGEIHDGSYHYRR